MPDIRTLYWITVTYIPVYFMPVIRTLYAVTDDVLMTGIHCISGYRLHAQFNLIPLHISVSEFLILISPFFCCVTLNSLSLSINVIMSLQI